MGGWIKLYRKLLDWEWYQNSQMVHLFIHLVLKANHVNRRWQGIAVKRGQVITGREKLSAETGISVPVIRRCLTRLENSGEITKKSANKYSVITICKYDDYQSEIIGANQLVSQQRTSKKPATHQQKATNKKEKNNKEEKEYSSEILDFYEDIIVFFPESTKPANNYQKSKWMEIIIKLQKRGNYSLAEIKNIIKHFRQDSFWASNFLSLTKLLKKNKDGILYIDVFAEKIKQIRPDYKINSTTMQNTLKNPNRLKF